MGGTHSIFVSVDKETHRRARIRAEQFKLSVPEFAVADSGTAAKIFARTPFPLLSV